MSAISYPHIEIVGNGKAYVLGTGIKVRVLAELHLAGADVDELHARYPHLSKSQLHSALAYYYDHQSAFDREISDLEQLEEELRPQLENRETTERLRHAKQQRSDLP